MKYFVTMYNPKPNYSNVFSVSFSEDESGLETLKDFLNVFQESGYRDIVFKPVFEELSAEQRRIYKAINANLNISKMSLFVTGEKSIHVEDATGSIDFYSLSPDGPIYDSFHGVVPLGPIAP